MARSLKKGPFVQESLQKKIAKMNEAGTRYAWSYNCCS